MAVEAKAVTRAITLENPHRVGAVDFDLLSHCLQSIALEPGQDEFGDRLFVASRAGNASQVTAEPCKFIAIDVSEDSACCFAIDGYDKPRHKTLLVIMPIA